MTAIARMALSFSSSAEAFAQHSHLLDGAIGRALAYLGIALLLGLRFWIGRQPYIPHIHKYRWMAVALGVFGMLLWLNGIYWQAVDPFALDVLSPALSLTDFILLMLGSSFGWAWLAFLGLICASAVMIKKPVAWLWLVLATAAIAASGHAGELGLRSWEMWIDTFHALLGLTWLGAMAILAIGRISHSWYPGPAVLRQFSTLALPLFLLILIAGFVRLGLLYLNGNGLDPLYCIMLGIKLAAVAGVIASAWHLRKLLHAMGEQPHQAEQYDAGISLELFCAAVLVFATALLTQLPPI